MWCWPNILYIFLPNCWSRQGTIWERPNRSRCQWLTHDYRVVARVFVKGGIIASTEGTRLVRGYGGIVPQKIFKFGGSETFFSVLVMRYVRKIDLGYENGKQFFQVTITKITESKENKSIHRLDVSGSTGPRGELPPPPPPCPLASYGSGLYT